MKQFVEIDFDNIYDNDVKITKYTESMDPAFIQKSNLVQYILNTDECNVKRGLITKVNHDLKTAEITPVIVEPLSAISSSSPTINQNDVVEITHPTRGVVVYISKKCKKAMTTKSMSTL